MSLLCSAELGAALSLAMEVVDNRRRTDVRPFWMMMLVGRQKVVRIGPGVERPE